LGGPIVPPPEAVTAVSEEAWVWVPFEVDKKFDGWRIDRFLAARLQGYSRNKVQGMLDASRIVKQGKPAKANARVKTSDKIQIAYPRRPEDPLAPDAELPILFEDDDLFIINKPTNLLSHPTDKVVNRTVLGVVRHFRPDIKSLHLLHRLDRETSGVLALAKNPKAARAWTRAMERHAVRKEYLALVHGKVTPAEGVIDMPIGRENGPIKIRQWVNIPGAVRAITKYSVLSHFRGQSPQTNIAHFRGLSPDSIVRIFPETGRLHQIRVHFAAIGHPLLGDYLYMGQGELYLKMIKEGLTDADRARLGFARIALHAAALSFEHPVTEKPMRIEAPLPDDMAGITVRDTSL